MCRARALAALLPLLLAGCATAALRDAPARDNEPWYPATTEEPKSNVRGYVLPSNPELGVMPPPPTLRSGHAYTLPELIDIAESNNPDTRVAWDSARNAALAEGIAKSIYLPRISASVVAGYQVSGGHNSAFGFGASSSDHASGIISAISAQWLLFDFGGRAAAVEAAKQASTISNIGFTAAHQRLIYQVSLAYYANAAAEARVANAAQALKNALDVEAAADARNKRGIGTIVETAQAHQAAAQARLAQVQANGAAQNSHYALLAVMGVSPLTRIAIADMPARKLSPKLSASADRIVSEALARRPDIQSAYAAQRASAANVEAAEANFLPKVFLSATGSYETSGLTLTALPPVGQEPGTVNLGSHQLGGVVIAGVTIPIYDGGVKDALLAQARNSADRADAQLKRTRDDAVREIVEAQNGLETSLAAHDAAQSLEAASETTFKAALASYRYGVGSLTDATIAETQWLQAKNAVADTYSAAFSAAATLAYATGSLGAAPE